MNSIKIFIIAIERQRKTRRKVTWNILKFCGTIYILNLAILTKNIWNNNLLIVHREATSFEINVIAENPVRPSTTENGNVTEMISKLLQTENINETVTAINNKELHDKYIYIYIYIYIKK